MKKLYILSILTGMGISMWAGVNSPAAPGYFDRGVKMFSLENYVGALDQLRQASKSRMLTSAEQCRLEQLEALCLLHRGHYDQASALFRAWLDKWGAAPQRSDVLMSLGDCFFGNSYPEALKIYEMVDRNALTTDQLKRELTYRTGYCCLQTALWDRARVSFTYLLGSPEYRDAANFYLAYIDYVNGDINAAKTGFLNCNTAVAPGNLANYYLTQIYYREGDYARALNTAKALLRQGNAPKSFIAEANRIAGESLYLTDNFSQAVPYLRNYVANVESPELSSLYILGLSEYNTGNYKDAVKYLKQVTEDKSSMGQNAYVYLGQALLNEGETDAAIMAFDRALNMSFDIKAQEAAYYNYAVAKYAGGNVPFGSSVTVFEEFLKKYPSSAQADNVRQYIITGYLTDNNYEAALQSINRVSNPNAQVLSAKQQVLYTLGSRNLASGNLDNAISQLREALSLGSHNASLKRETQLSLGEALLRKGENEEAQSLLSAYLKGTKTDNTPVALYDLGYAELALHNYPEAESAFTRMLASPGSLSAPAVSDAWTRLGDARYYQKEWAKAAQAYEKAYSAYPESGDYPLFQQAVMQGYAGNFDRKKEILNRLEEEFPASALLPDALLEKTEAMLRTNDTDGAMATWQQLIDKFPATAQGRSAYLQMAVTLENEGNDAKAIDVYKTLIARFPTSDEAVQASEAYKRLAANNGQLDEYLSFMNGIDNAPRMDAGEVEKLAFETAETHYLDGKGLKLLEQYASRYGTDGVYALQTYTYLMDDADVNGNGQKAYNYATVIADRWPNNAAAEQAYAIMGDYEYNHGLAEQALHSWQQLENRASTPAMVNEARTGIMRAARQLNRPDELLNASEALLQSATLGTEEKTEANFSRGLALQLKGDTAGAINVWKPLSAIPDDLYGAQAAVYAAEALLDSGDKNGAKNIMETFVNSGTPHAYWLARGFIVLSDAYRSLGKSYEANEYLKALRENYPGNEPDIFNMIDQRLAK